MPTEPRLALFLAAVRGTGGAYRAARDALLAIPEHTRWWAAAPAQHPKVQLLAAVLGERLAHPEVFEEVARRMRAEGSRQPSRVSPRRRGEAIAALGPPAVVPVLELLVFERDVRPTPERAALDHALVVLRDPRAIPHLVERMSPRRDPTERAAAAHTLARQRAPAAAPVFARYLADPASPSGLAAACARGLTLLRSPASAQVLLAAGTAPALPEATRATAIEALTSQWTDALDPALIELARTGPPAVADAALGVLARRGTEGARAALEAVAHAEADPARRAAAIRAAAQIAARLANPPPPFPTEIELDDAPG